MLDLWEALSVELGSAFARQFGSPQEQTFEHWLQELWKFSKEDLFKGFESFKNSGSTYISLNVLRSHCKAVGVSEGVPTIEQALTLVINRAWESLHPAFQIVAQQTYEIVETRRNRFGDLVESISKRPKYDLARLRGLDHQTALREIRPFYQEVVNRISTGETFERIVAIEESNETPSGTKKQFGKDRGRKALSDLLSEMRGTA